ncbi:MAG: hypothetical protein GY945_05490 [Rhodobacteraceae bacterium]|nr:hypothetical protein [Paracoccaceae bacterium]
MPVVADRWDGFCVGVYAGTVYDGIETVFGIMGGHNRQSGTFVFGVELDAFSASPSSDSGVFLNARAGVALGDTRLCSLKQAVVSITEILI